MGKVFVPSLRKLVRFMERPFSGWDVSIPSQVKDFRHFSSERRSISMYTTNPDVVSFFAFKIPPEIRDHDGY